MDHDTFVEIPFDDIEVNKKYHLAGGFIGEPGVAVILEKNSKKHTIVYAMIHDEVSWDDKSGFNAFTNVKRSRPVNFTDIEKGKKYYLHNAWTDETIYAIIIGKNSEYTLCTYAQIHDAVNWNDGGVKAYKRIPRSTRRSSSSTVIRSSRRSPSKGGKRKRRTCKIITELIPTYIGCNFLL